MVDKTDLHLLKQRIKHRSCGALICHRGHDPHSTMSSVMNLIPIEEFFCRHGLSYHLQKVTELLEQALRHPANISRSIDVSGNEILSFVFHSEVHLDLPLSVFDFYDVFRLNHFRIHSVFALNLIFYESDAKIEDSNTDGHSLGALVHTLVLILWLIFLAWCACIVLDILLKQENQNANRKDTLFPNSSSDVILVEAPCGCLQVGYNPKSLLTSDL